MTHVDVKTVQGPHGAWYVQVPEGFVLCLVEKEKADGEWRECAAVRIVADEAGTVAAFEACDDLDWLTSPEAEK